MPPERPINKILLWKKSTGIATCISVHHRVFFLLFFFQIFQSSDRYSGRRLNFPVKDPKISWAVPLAREYVPEKIHLNGMFQSRFEALSNGAIPFTKHL